VLDWRCEATGEKNQHNVDLADVESAARGVRGALNTLARRIKSGRDHGAIRAVAQAGRWLYDCLVPEGKELRELLGSLRTLDLHIAIVDHCQLPWGAIYSGASPGEDEPADQENFWCIKHNVVAYPPSALDIFDIKASAADRWISISYVPQNRRRPRHSESCDNLQKFEETCDQHKSWTWALYLRDPHLQSSGGIDFLRTVKKHGGRFTELKRPVSRSKLAGMLFVDGVDVSIDEPAGAEIWREVWRNWQGMVVNEVPIPSSKQLNFCVELVEKVRSGEKMSELVRDVRRNRRAEALLYGIYCLPDFGYRKWERT
jgi:hypothetical protein